MSIVCLEKEMAHCSWNVEQMRRNGKKQCDLGLDHKGSC